MSFPLTTASVAIEPFKPWHLPLRVEPHHQAVRLGQRPPELINTGESRWFPESRRVPQAQRNSLCRLGRAHSGGVCPSMDEMWQDLEPSGVLGE